MSTRFCASLSDSARSMVAGTLLGTSTIKVCNYNSSVNQALYPCISLGHRTLRIYLFINNIVIGLGLGVRTRITYMYLIDISHISYHFTRKLQVPIRHFSRAPLRMAQITKHNTENIKI